MIKHSLTASYTSRNLTRFITPRPLYARRSSSFCKKLDLRSPLGSRLSTTAFAVADACACSPGCFAFHLKAFLPPFFANLPRGNIHKCPYEQKQHLPHEFPNLQQGIVAESIVSYCFFASSYPSVKVDRKHTQAYPSVYGIRGVSGLQRKSLKLGSCDSLPLLASHRVLHVNLLFRRTCLPYRRPQPHLAAAAFSSVHWFLDHRSKLLLSSPGKRLIFSLPATVRSHSFCTMTPAPLRAAVPTTAAAEPASTSGDYSGGIGCRTRRDKLLAIEAAVARDWGCCEEAVKSKSAADAGVSVASQRKENPYEVDAPANFVSAGFPAKEKQSHQKEKYYCSFPYPYMNGKMHLGHAYTICRAEFQARFQRLQGKSVLWPFALHCTGMPILACADKLKRELHERQQRQQQQAGEIASADAMKADAKKLTCEEEQEEAAVSGDAKKKKSKVAMKCGDSLTQWDIMLNMGIPEEEVAAFADAQHWLQYFPPLAVRDMKALGLAVDWRRSFITTDANPFYDAFVRWQFNTLLKRNKLKFGMRATIFSRRERQACADHDRASGEGCGPQEYVLVKLSVQQQQEKEGNRLLPRHQAFLRAAAPDGRQREVALVAATLRPETTYGQTNCFVLPEGRCVDTAACVLCCLYMAATIVGFSYGLYLAFDTPRKSLSAAVAGNEDATNNAAAAAEATAAAAAGVDEEFDYPMTRKEALECCPRVLVCSERSALNMCYQGLMPVEQEDAAETAAALPKPHCLTTVSGMDLIGLPLSAPNSHYPTIYVLPMLSILMNKGTGVVMSVPSDSPDDYAAFMDVKNKLDYFRDKYGVLPEWAEPFNLVEIIDIPGLGRQAAARLCKEKKIQSQKDTAKLKEAKEEVYVKGFYDGVLVVGPYAGEKVSKAKPFVRAELLARGEALLYYEPENSVVSRSGDECVVAYMNQWYLDYGEKSWQEAVSKYINSDEFHTYSPQVLHQFKHVVEWLREWACSRSYGLGTFLPWTKHSPRPVLIESLSDSTIYMAYYTISHLLQGDDMYGKQLGPLGIKPDDLTDEVFDYVFLQTDELPSTSSIPTEYLQRMRREFEYWYPLNLRVSGKDLIFNHLVFCLYNHAAIWPGRPELWPKAFVCNGHLMLDAQKMSKSQGNFLTVEDGVAEYSADALRIALADAGDSVDDANFQSETANGSIMRLYLLEQFANDVIKEAIPLREGSLDQADLLFYNEIVTCAAEAASAYENFQYREALKNAFYEMHTRRDQYKLLCGERHMHRDMLILWLKTEVRILTPIAPHICEHIWSRVLGENSFVVTASWPTFSEHPQDPILHREFLYLFSSVEEFRRTKEKAILLANGGGRKKGMQAGVRAVGLPALSHAVIYVATDYPALQQQVLRLLQTIPLQKNEDGVWVANGYMDVLKADAGINALDKLAKKEALSFASFVVRDELKAFGPCALDLHLPFDELKRLQAHRDYIKAALDLLDLEIVSNESPHVKDSSGQCKLAKPGKPSIYFSAA